jgi:hypothetical protein
MPGESPTRYSSHHADRDQSATLRTIINFFPFLIAAPEMRCGGEVRQLALVPVELTK